MIILDTCTLLWLVADQQRLSKKAKNVIAKNAGALFVSSISAFEIAVKARNDKLRFEMEALDWFKEAINFHGIVEVPITAEIAMCSVQLPQLHKDPCDRMIIATAKINSMKIVTCDTLISQYKMVESVW